MNPLKLKPIIPFEPIRTDEVPTGPNWTAQVKWDGVRMLAYADGSETRLWNRRRNERSTQYPEFLDIRSYCNSSSVILDGEMIALDGGKPSFHRIMKRDRMRIPERIKLAVDLVPVTYMIFDVLYVDGQWVIDKPLAERQRLLEQIVVPGPTVQLVRNVADSAALFETMRTFGMEGIVVKDLTSKYAPAGKDGRWQKRKLYHDLYAAVGGVTFRDNIVNALLLGLYDDKGDLHYIGHAGAGKLTQADWRSLTERIAPLVVGKRPFCNLPERHRSAVWLRPQLAVRVQFLEWSPDGVMRQPIIQSFVDVGPDRCTFGQ